MEMLKIRSRTDAAGFLRVDFSTNIKESNVELVIMISPVRKACGVLNMDIIPCFYF